MFFKYVTSISTEMSSRQDNYWLLATDTVLSVHTSSKLTWLLVCFCSCSYNLDKHCIPYFMLIIIAEIKVGQTKEERIYCIYEFSHKIFTESEVVFGNMESLCIAENGHVSVTLTGTISKYISYSLPTYRTTQEDTSGTRDQLPPEFPILAVHIYQQKKYHPEQCNHHIDFTL